MAVNLADIYDISQNCSHDSQHAIASRVSFNMIGNPLLYMNPTINNRTFALIIIYPLILIIPSLIRSDIRPFS